MLVIVSVDSVKKVLRWIPIDRKATAIVTRWAPEVIDPGPVFGQFRLAQALEI